MARRKPASPVLTDDDDNSKAALGCLAAVVVVVGVALAVALLGDFSGNGPVPPEEEAAARTGGSSGGLPITKVEALDNKTQVSQARGQVLARNLEPADDDRGVVAGHTGVIADLFSDYYQHGAEPEQITQALDRRSVCYNGRHARLVRPILAPDSRGFAMTFGAASHAEGDPYPRLEFFHGIADDLDYVYYVSLTRAPVRGFDPVGVRIRNTRKAVGRVMLEWVAEIANSACPPRQPAEPQPPRAAQGGT